MPKFKTLDEYYQWCDAMVTKIYYANIAMNDQAIADVVSKIASVLHVPNHDSLIGADTSAADDESA